MVDAGVEQAVRTRAGNRCEYCHVPQTAYLTPHQIDHIIARKHGGSDALDNLAVACFHCNLHKGPNIAGVDSETQRISPLFHPRKDQWLDHFRLLPSGVLLGRTPEGRATLSVLNMNDPDAVAVRAVLIDEGQLQPDPVSG